MGARLICEKIRHGTPIDQLLDSFRDCPKTYTSKKRVLIATVSQWAVPTDAVGRKGSTLRRDRRT